MVSFNLTTVNDHIVRGSYPSSSFKIRQGLLPTLPSPNDAIELYLITVTQVCTISYGTENIQCFDKNKKNQKTLVHNLN